MLAKSVKVKGHLCFKHNWAGFDEIKPVNVIIGRNNTGKSQLLEIVQTLCGESFKRKGWKYQLSGTLDEQSLKAVFSPGTSQGELGGRYWDDHGVHFLNKPVTWTADEALSVIEFTPAFDIQSKLGERSTRARENELRNVLRSVQHQLQSRRFRSILADRDIRPEPELGEMKLEPSGAGATNVLRRYLTTSNSRFPASLIQREVLNALNQIFGVDGSFTGINVRKHDEPESPMQMQVQNSWEVYLGEEKKDFVALSSSGSGLKTVILVLLNLIVIPAIERRSKSDYVFAFEELENNLHPALQRRLLRYIEDYVVRESAHVFLTTHSSTALDLFGPSEHAQIIHVSHDGESASVRTINAHFDHLGVLSDLGAKPSDLLQANGIIWVEGPSDRIYLNKWIDAFSGGRFREGRDYQCAYYGGALLARAQFRSPEEADAEFANLLRLNSNIIVLCDSDRTAADGDGFELKDRVSRIKREVETIPKALLWITEAKEIENYIPAEAFQAAFALTTAIAPEQYERFFPSETASTPESFVERCLNRRSMDKMDLAVRTTPAMTVETLSERFDLAHQMRAVVAKISEWNS